MTFRPTHFAPVGGLRTWDQPDPSLPNGPPIAAQLPIAVVRRYGAWTQVACENGWTAWVDDRELAGATPAPSPSGGGFALPSTGLGRLYLGVAAVLIVATFLPWFSVGSVSATAWKVPLAFLVDDGASGAPWLAWGLLLLAAASVLGALRAMSPKLLAAAAGVGALAAALHAFQVSRIAGASLGNVGIGAWAVLGTGVLAAAAPWLAARRGASASAAATPVVVPVMSAPLAPAPVPVAPVPVAPVPVVPVPVAPVPATPVAAAPSAAWVPTHRVPSTGMACYVAPDPATASGIRLDPWLAVQVIDSRSGWSQVRCSNGWTTWVDGRRLEVQP
jgi:hypothetical protein